MTMHAEAASLVPAAEMAARNPSRFPGESAEYRRARNALLAEEIELRRHIERVAEARRRLPPGGAVTRSSHFDGPDGPVTLDGLFGGRDSLIVYSYMFGPERAEPCPMCTSLMDAWEGKAPDIAQRVGFAMVARSPIARLIEAKVARGWRRLPVYSDADGAFTRDYVSADDDDVPGYTVFTRGDGVIRHFWSAEMREADPGQDPRGAPDPDPLWALLDTTPEGRGADWYPNCDIDPDRPFSGLPRAATNFLPRRSPALRPAIEMPRPPIHMPSNEMVLGWRAWETSKICGPARRTAKRSRSTSATSTSARSSCSSQKASTPTAPI